MKEINKEKKYIEMIKRIFVSCLFLIIIFGIIFFILNAFMIYNDCYESHFKECEYAHNINKTYYLCSGFIGEPIKDDMEIFCAFHPEESCDNIPHGCVLKENEYLVGIKIPLTKLEWRFIE